MNRDEAHILSEDPLAEFINKQVSKHKDRTWEAIDKLLNEYWKRYDELQPTCPEGEVYTMSEDDFLRQKVWVSYVENLDRAVIFSDEHWKKLIELHNGPAHGVTDPCSCKFCMAN
jgi:hypothetical protein